MGRHNWWLWRGSQEAVGSACRIKKGYNLAKGLNDTPKHTEDTEDTPPHTFGNLGV